MSRPPTVSNSFKSRQIEVADYIALGNGIKAINPTTTLQISGNTNTSGSILSSGIDLFNIFTTEAAASGIQSLSFNELNYDLSITQGNTVSLSALDISSSVAALTASLPSVFDLYLSTNNVTVSSLVVTTGLTAQSSNIPVTVIDLTTSNFFTNTDTNKIFHFNTTSNSLCAIIPNTLSNGFNIAIMNTGTNNLVVSAENLNSTGATIVEQYGAAYIYKQNNTIFAVGRLF